METRVRASDAERETYAEKVRQAVGEGRLTIGEGDERMRVIYASVYRDELAPLVSDLPPDPPPAPARRGSWGAAGSFEEGDPGRGDVAGRPHWHARRRRGWFPVGPLAVAAILVGVWAISGAHFFWPAIPLAFLTVIFLRRLMWWRWYAPRR